MIELIFQYLEALLDLFKDLFTYMFLGFLLAAITQEFVSTERLLRYFGKNDISSLLRATFAGFLVSSCSCGAIPLAVIFRKKGASTATILTFLLASPWAGLPMIFIFFGFIGFFNTIILMILALSTAFLSGLILAELENRDIIEQKFNSMHKDNEKEKCLECEKEKEEEHKQESILKRIFICIPKNMKEIFFDIGKYIVIGLFLAAFLKAFVPTEIVYSYLGKERGVMAIFIALPFAVIIEACSEGFAIIAGQLYSMGATLSVVFVMTMAGVATDLTEILVVWKRIGKKATIAYLFIGTFLTLMLSMLLLMIS
ncbi:MAG: permease [Candidatus Altiarchaeota archaeon]